MSLPCPRGVSDFLIFIFKDTLVGVLDTDIALSVVRLHPTNVIRGLTALPAKSVLLRPTVPCRNKFSLK